MPPAKRGGEPSASTGLPFRKRFRASDPDGTTAHAEVPTNAHAALGGIDDEPSTLGRRGTVPDEEGAQSLGKESGGLGNLLPSVFHAVVDTIREDCTSKSSDLQGDTVGTSGSHAVGVRQESAALDTDPGAPPRRPVQPMQNNVVEPLPGTRQINCTTPTFVERTSESPVVLRGNIVSAPTVEPLNPSDAAPSVQNARRRPIITGRRRPTYMKPEMFAKPAEGYHAPRVVPTNSVAPTNVTAQAGSSDTSLRQQVPSVSASLSRMQAGSNGAPFIAHQDRPYPCTECPRRFATRPQFTKHYKTVHLKEKPFVCPQCQRAFGNKSNMAVHVRTVHLKERKYQCNYCQRRFGAKPDLTKHIRAVHLKVREHQCQICGSRFGREPELLRHVKSVHNKERPHRCAHCQRRFAHKSSLTKHIRTVHFNERPYECRLCDARFSNTSNLSRHERTVHPREFVAGIPRDDDPLTADEDDSSSQDENYQVALNSNGAAQVCSPVPVDEEMAVPNSGDGGGGGGGE